MPRNFRDYTITCLRVNVPFFFFKHFNNINFKGRAIKYLNSGHSIPKLNSLSLGQHTHTKCTWNKNVRPEGFTNSCIVSTQPLGRIIAVINESNILVTGKKFTPFVPIQLSHWTIKWDNCVGTEKVTFTHSDYSHILYRYLTRRMTILGFAYI